VKVHQSRNEQRRSDAERIIFEKFYIKYEKYEEDIEDILRRGFSEDDWGSGFLEGRG